MKLVAKKSLGQHFLKSPAALAKIISSADLKSGEIVLEIGPGTGILTDALLKTGARVIAIEKDHRAYELLKEKYHAEIKNSQLVLICDDILKFDPGLSGLEEGRYCLVANIPYYITGAILEKFLEYGPRPDRMVLLVQKEVAERVVATPVSGKNKESILSISVKAFGKPKIVARVPRGAFVPAPNVDSAILNISDISNRHFRDKNLDIKRFFDLIKTAFAHKRKYALRNLESLIDPEILKYAWNKAGLPITIRAEDISLEKWFELASLV